MGWRDRLEIGSFRGVPFYYDRVSGEFGRKTVLREFPGGDKPFVEDLGLATRRFTLDMYVIGPDYDGDRDSLRDALEVEGSGTLVHPYWGEMNVCLDGKATCTEDVREGGLARFSATFVQDGGKIKERVIIDTQSSVLDAATALVEKANAAFAAVFSTINEIAATVQKAINMINAVASAIKSIEGKVRALLLVVTSLQDAIQSVQDNAKSLLSAPADLASSMNDLISLGTQSITDVADSIAELSSLIVDEEGLPNEGAALALRTQISTLTSAIIDMAAIPSVLPVEPYAGIALNNSNAMSLLIQASVISAVSQVAVGLAYESRDQALAMNTQINALFDTLLARADLSDDVYGPLVNLRASVFEHFDQAAATLPEITQYVSPISIPAIVLAYQLFGDATKEGDLVARNDFSDPTTFPGGQPIEILL